MPWVWWAEFVCWAVVVVGVAFLLTFLGASLFLLLLGVLAFGTAMVRLPYLRYQIALWHNKTLMHAQTEEAAWDDLRHLSCSLYFFLWKTSYVPVAGLLYTSSILAIQWRERRRRPEF